MLLLCAAVVVGSWPGARGHDPGADDAELTKRDAMDSVGKAMKTGRFRFGKRSEDSISKALTAGRMRFGKKSSGDTDDSVSKALTKGRMRFGKKSSSSLDDSVSKALTSGRMRFGKKSGGMDDAVSKALTNGRMRFGRADIAAGPIQSAMKNRMRFGKRSSADDTETETSDELKHEQSGPNMEAIDAQQPSKAEVSMTCTFN